jgi:thymidylate kinase
MNENVVIIEGYDGSGKSTLIDVIRDTYRNKRVRVIGRKNEPELLSLSHLIEHDPQPLSNSVELLLRIALEIERLKIVTDASSKHDLVIMDRGLISLEAWVGYYDLEPSAYSSLFSIIERALEGATLFVCRCPFDECWRRISDKGNKSKKELLGKAINKEWYAKYGTACDAFVNPHYKLIQVDTECPIQQSAQSIRSTIEESWRDTFV